MNTNDIDIDLGPVTDLTKSGLTNKGAQYALDILDAGDVSPMDFLIRLRAVQIALEEAIAVATEAAIPQAEQDSGETLHGVKFEYRRGSARYDFSGDTAWNELKAHETEAANGRKAREKMLKNLTDRVIDPETGEYIDPPVVTYGASTVALTFPK